jgi:hypothetical protein
MRVALIVLLVVAASVLGYFGREVIGSTPSDTKLQFPDRGYSPSTFNLGCTAVTAGSAFEDRLDGPSANAHAGPGTEEVALALSGDGKTLSVLYAYDVGNGATEPIPLVVHSGPNIRANCVSPGWIETKDYSALRRKDHAQHPAGRVGKPQDIAEIVAWLLDRERFGFVTGANFVIDGGMTRKMIYEERGLSGPKMRKPQERILRPSLWRPLRGG